MNIPELLDKRETVNVKHSAESNARQAAFEAECQVAWKKKFPKRKFTLTKSAKDNQPEHGEIYKRRMEEYQAADKKHMAEVDAIKAQIKEAAKDAEIPVFDGMTFYDSVDSSHYMSQGFGEHKYARADAEDKADKARAYGLQVYVREVVRYEGKDSFGFSSKTSDYEIWVSTTVLGVEILKNKPEKETMSDWVKKCDKQGVCARVFFPFMTYEQEEKLRKAGAQ